MQLQIMILLYYYDHAAKDYTATLIIGLSVKLYIGVR